MSARQTDTPLGVGEQQRSSGRVLGVPQGDVACDRRTLRQRLHKEGVRRERPALVRRRASATPDVRQPLSCAVHAPLAGQLLDSVCGVVGDLAGTLGTPKRVQRGELSVRELLAQCVLPRVEIDKLLDSQPCAIWAVAHPVVVLSCG